MYTPLKPHHEYARPLSWKFPPFCRWGDTASGKILVFSLLVANNKSFLLLIFGLVVSFSLTPTKRWTQFSGNICKACPGGAIRSSGMWPSARRHPNRYRMSCLGSGPSSPITLAQAPQKPEMLLPEVQRSQVTTEAGHLEAQPPHPLTRLSGKRSRLSAPVPSWLERGTSECLALPREQ